MKSKSPTPGAIHKEGAPAKLFAENIIENMIYLVRGQKVMLDSDLASLYGVETKRLKEQVKRNIKRFPDDFMFQLSKGEYEILRSHFATSSWGGKSQKWEKGMTSNFRLFSQLSKNSLINSKNRKSQKVK